MTELLTSTKQVIDKAERAAAEAGCLHHFKAARRWAERGATAAEIGFYTRGLFRSEIIEALREEADAKRG